MRSAGRVLSVLVALAVVSGCKAPSDKAAAKPAAAKTAAGGLDRTVLPIAEPTYPEITEIDARKATAPPRFEVKAPERAPNVVIVLIDDIGFGHSSTFGGPINMPTLDSAGRTTGCATTVSTPPRSARPTRTALLTGRNHHVNNAGAIMELATAFPGNTGIRPNSVAPLAQILRLNGYSTAAFGKYHETPPWEASVSGPYDRWPTGSGFDKFYGFIGGETNQWAPAIYDGVTRVGAAARPELPLHHRHDQPGDRLDALPARVDARTSPSTCTSRPAPRTRRTTCPKEYIAKYKGKFDQGWDKLREETLARQIELGVVPAGTKLTARPAEIPAWDSLSADQKRLFARQMETFAGFGEHTDHEVGRLVEALRDMGELDNTLFFYIVGDNGSSAEGGPDGSYNEILALNGIVSDVSSQLSHIDDWGGPTTFPHFSIGWAHAGNTPFQWTKQVASHFGGTRNPMVISWPARLEGPRRGPFAVSSRHRRRADRARSGGASGAHSWSTEPSSTRWTASRWCTRSTTPAATDRHTTQYFEMFGNRAIYHDGWVAATRHSIPWLDGS